MGDNRRHPLVEQAYQARRNGDRRGALALYVTASRRLRAEGGHAGALASAVRHTGDLCEELGDTQETWAAYEDAWAIYATLTPSQPLDEANCRRPMALWQERHGDPAVALELWREARALYERAAVTTGLDLQAAYDECDRHIAALGTM